MNIKIILKNKNIIILICIFGAFLGGIFLFNNPNNTDIQRSILNRNEANELPYVPNAALPLAEGSEISADAVRGNPNAEVVIVEFCDFQYSLCAKAYLAIKKVLEAYPGKVKFVYKDYPLRDVHVFAQKAAEAGECAGEQGKYWEYHDKLFEYQQEWVGEGIHQFKKYAEELNLDVEKFNSCLDSGNYKEEVSKDLNEGKNLGITVIPFFFINNKTLGGAQSFEDFQKIIEGELNKLKEKQKYGEVEFFSFNKGIEEAKKYNKIALIYFRSDSCYWCMKFDEEVLTNKSVVNKINETFIPVAVNMDDEREISTKLNVFMTPSIVFMDSADNELKKLVGFRDAQTFLEELNEVSG